MIAVCEKFFAQVVDGLLPTRTILDTMDPAV